MSETVLWEGWVGADQYQVIEHAGGGNSVCAFSDDKVWIPISYGPETDAPQVSAVAAHLAQKLAEVTDERDDLDDSLTGARAALEEAGHYQPFVNIGIRALTRERDRLQNEKSEVEALLEEGAELRLRVHNGEVRLRVVGADDE